MNYYKKLIENEKAAKSQGTEYLSPSFVTSNILQLPTSRTAIIVLSFNNEF